MPEIPQITSQTAWQLLLDNENSLLVDVRTETEWQAVGVPDPSETGPPRSVRVVDRTSGATAIPTSQIRSPTVSTPTRPSFFYAGQESGQTLRLNC